MVPFEDCLREVARSSMEQRVQMCRVLGLCWAMVGVIGSAKHLLGSASCCFTKKKKGRGIGIDNRAQKDNRAQAVGWASGC